MFKFKEKSIEIVDDSYSFRFFTINNAPNLYLEDNPNAKFKDAVMRVVIKDLKNNKTYFININYGFKHIVREADSNNSINISNYEYFENSSETKDNYYKNDNINDLFENQFTKYLLNTLSNIDKLELLNLLTLLIKRVER